MATIETLLVKIEADTARLRRELERADKATAQADRSIRGSLDRVAKGFAPVEAAVGKVNRALAAVGIGGAITAAAGFAALAAGMSRAVREAEATERAQLKLAGVLRATDQASGQTVASIERIVESMSRSTLATEENVRAAAGQLLTFRAVAGETFERTLKLSQDLASLGFGSLASNATRLGKALEDPVRGVAQLREVGVSFSTQQGEVIKKLVETGKEAEAMRLILDTVEKQVGGTGAAEAGGVSGAFHVLTENVGDFFEAVAERLGLLDALEEKLRTLAGAAQQAAALVNPSLSDQLTNVTGQLETLRRQRAAALGGASQAQIENAARLRGLTPEQFMQGPGGAGQIESLESKRGDLLRRLDAERKRADAAAIAAQEAARKAADERDADRRRALAEETAKKIAEGEEKIRDIARDREAKLAAEYDQGRIDASKRTAEVLEHLREEAHKKELDRQKEETAERERAMEKAARAAEKAQEQINQIAADAISRITDFGADALFRRLKGEAGSFWEEFKDLALRAFAQIAASAVIPVVVAPFVNGALGATGGAGGGLLGGIAQSAGGSVLSNALGLNSLGAQLGSALNLGGGFFGATAGGLTVAGGGLASSLGVAAVPGGIVNAASASAGLFGGGGILGLGAAGGPLALGALALGGLALGGAFSRQSARGATQGAGFNIGSAANGGPEGRFFYSLGVDNGGDASAVAAEAERALAALNRIAEVTGVTPTQAQIQALAQRTVRVGTGDFTLNSLGSFERGGVRTADDLVRDLVQGGLFGDPANPALQTIAAQGLAAFDQAKAVSDGIGRALLAITDPMSAALDQLAEEHAARLEAVRAAGGSIVDAERLYGLQRQQIIDQYQQQELAKLESTKGQIVNFFASILTPLTNFRSSLNIGPQSALSPGDQLAMARGEFDQLFGLAQSGNRAAIEAFPQVAQQFLGASRAVNASGPGFASDFSLTNTRLNQVIGQVQTLQTDNFANLAQTFELSIQDQTAQLRKELQTLTAAVNRMRAAA